MANDNDSPAPTISSRLNGHLFNEIISDTSYNFRILKMNGALFVYIGQAENEVFQEMAVAMPLSSASDYLATSILGEQMSCSHELSMNFARKLNKPVYLSCNVPAERELRPVLAKRFSDEVRKCPEHF